MKENQRKNIIKKAISKIMISDESEKKIADLFVKNSWYLLLVAILISLIAINNTSAEENFAKAKIVKGSVTVLIPGAKEAKELKEGDSLPEDTSILTKERSFVKIVLHEGSELNLGPSSKMVLERHRSNKEPGVVNLITGKLKSTIKKEINNDVKMILKTRSASMGVRGTDFLIVYNPETEAASLVTFEGKVAIVPGKSTDIQELKKTLTETKDLVTDGKFFGINPEKKSTTTSVSKDQLKILQDSLEKDPTGSQENLKLSSDDKIVDLKTAQVVLGKTGFVNAITGEFTPVKGLELTNKGFAPKNTEDGDKILLAKKFNNEINGEKVWFKKFLLSNELYSQRDDFHLGNNKVAVKNDWVNKIKLGIEATDLDNSFYFKIGIMKSKLSSLGATQNISGNINQQTYKDLEFGYERRISDRVNLFVESGLSDNPELINNDVVKKSEARVSVGTKVKFLTSEKLYPYSRIQLDHNFDEGTGVELGVGLNKEFKNVGVRGDVWINRSSDRQKGGLLLGLTVGF